MSYGCNQGLPALPSAAQAAGAPLSPGCERHRKPLHQWEPHPGSKQVSLPNTEAFCETQS